LIRIEAGVDLGEGAGDGGLKLLVGFNSSLGAGGGFGGVEGFGGKGIGKISESSTVIHRRLRSFGFQVVEDSGHLHDLFFFEVELVGEESQWSADTETAETFIG
jgi:hypothetical protein